MRFFSKDFLSLSIIDVPLAVVAAATTTAKAVVGPYLPRVGDTASQNNKYDQHNLQLRFEGTLNKGVLLFGPIAHPIVLEQLFN